MSAKTTTRKPKQLSDHELDRTRGGFAVEREMKESGEVVSDRRPDLGQDGFKPPIGSGKGS